MPKKPNYTLKAGAVVHPQGTSDFYTLNNIPDDVAENWLGRFPGEIDKFESYPADWESRVQARKEGKVAEPTIDEQKDIEIERLTASLEQKDIEIERLTASLEQKDIEIERLTASLEQKDIEIEGLKANAGGDDGAAAMEIETLKADLEAANETIEKGKAEIERLTGELEAATAKKTTRKTAPKTDE